MKRLPEWLAALSVPIVFVIASIVRGWYEDRRRRGTFVHRYRGQSKEVRRIG